MNENNEQNTSPEEFKMPEEQFGSPVDTSPEETSYTGIILAILIVLLAIVLGGLYMWSVTLTTEPVPAFVPERPTAEENNEPESNNAEADVQITETLSTSDEISAIEADLESTNFDSLDADMTAIEAELDAAIQ